MIRMIKNILIHTGVICSLALITVNILDWYNPFMDFVGRTAFVQFILIGCSLGVGILHIFAKH